MKRADIITALLNAGFEPSEGANHTRMAHRDGRVTFVGRHREVPEGTVRAIEKQTTVKIRP